MSDELLHSDIILCHLLISRVGVNIATDILCESDGCHCTLLFLKICYYGRQWDFIWCNDTRNNIPQHTPRVAMKEGGYQGFSVGVYGGGGGGGQGDICRRTDSLLVWF